MPSPEVPLSVDEQVTYFRMEMDHYDSRLPFGWASEYSSVTVSEHEEQPQHLKDNEDMVRRICNPFGPTAVPGESPESGSRD